MAEAMTLREAADAFAEGDVLEQLLGDSPPQADEPEKVREPIEATEEADEEYEAEAFNEAEDLEDNPEEEPDAETLETLADVAEALGVEISDLMANLKSNVKVQGQDHTVTLQELQNGYSRQQDYVKKTQQLAQERQDFQRRAQEAQMHVNHQAQVVGGAMQQLQQILVGEKAEVDKLRDSDPQRWAVEASKWQDRANQFQTLQQQAAQWWESSMEQQRLQADQQRAQIEQEEKNALWDAMPNTFGSKWGDPEARVLSDYLTEFWAPQDIATIMDHRFFVMAEKARRYDQSLKAADPAKKRVKNLPKIQKPQARQQRSTQTARARAADRRLQRTHSRDDAARSIAEIPGIEGLLG